MDNTYEKQDEKEIKIFQTKRIVKELSTYSGSGTSMITLVVPPKNQV